MQTMMELVICWLAMNGIGCFCLNPTVNEMWLAFSNVMFSAIDIYVPTVSSRTNCRPSKRYFVSDVRGASIVQIMVVLY